MTTVRAARLLLLLVSALCPALAAQTSLTIYNDGRVLVRRTVALAVPKGPSTQRVALGSLDPATLFSLDPSVTVGGLSYDGAVDEASVLRRSVGRRIVFRLPESKDTISALVLGVDPLRLQLPDGRVSFAMPGAALYPGDVVVADPTAALRLDSERAQDKLRLGYFTAGAAWRASYQVVLGTSDARVTGSYLLHVSFSTPFGSLVGPRHRLRSTALCRHGPVLAAQDTRCVPQRADHLSHRLRRGGARPRHSAGQP